MNTRHGQIRPSLPIVYGRHIDTPLTQNCLLFYKKHPIFLGQRYPGLDEHHIHDLQSGKVRGTCVLGWLTEHLTIRSLHPLKKDGVSLSRVLDIVYESVLVQIRALGSKIPDLDDRGLTKIFSDLMGHPKLQSAYDNKVMILKVHEDLSSMDQSLSYPWQIPSLPSLSIFRDLIRLDEFPGGPVTVTYDMLLSCFDKIECYFSYIITSTLMNSIEPYSIIGYQEFMDNMRQLLEDMYIDLGNASHYVLKSLEPLAVGNLLLQELHGRSSREFLGKIVESLHDKLPACGAWAQEISNLMGSMLRDHPEHGRRAVLEAYGLEKSIGFPIVDDEGGQLKMYRYGTSFRSVNTAGCERIKGYMIQELVWALYSKRSILLPIVHSGLYHEGITRIYKEEFIPARDAVFRIPPEEWSMVVFRKQFEFDYRPDDMDHLLDKAIAPTRSSVNQIWHPDVREAYGLQPPSVICKRRFPEWILDQQKIECKKYFAEWDRCGEVPLDERIILATAKEKEQKVESRSFSILTPVARILMTTVEHNLSESILPLLPNHSMLLSGAQLEKRIESLVSNYNTSGEIKIAFMMDFDQWNFTFRDRATFTFDDFFNQIFGVTHFKWPNKVFRSAKFFTGNPFTPPESDIQFTSWENHAGGNQGMRQKLWTAITQAAIGLAMESLPFKYQLIGSGDNQVLVAQVPENDQIEVAVNRIKQAIFEVSSYLGIAMKLSETYHSSRVFVYGRKYYLEGHPISSGMKATTRAAAGTSEGVPTVNQLISTSQNAGTQLCAATNHPYIGLIAGHIESYTVLLNHEHSATMRRERDSVLASLSLFCSDLSPFNFMQLPSHLYSGHKDVLTENLAMLKIIFEQDPNMAIAMSGMLAVEYGDVTPECLLALTLDPRSPNLNWPQSSESYIKSALRDYIKNVHPIVNHRVSAMMAHSSDDAIVSFASSLLQIRPLNLTVVHSLCEASMFGQVLSVVNRFVKLRTMTKMVNKARTDGDDAPFSSIIKKKDFGTIRAVTERLSRGGFGGDNFFACLFGCRYDAYRAWCLQYGHHALCTVSARRYLMIDSFKLDVSDIIGPYCPAPLEQIEISRLVDGEDLRTSIIITPSREIPPLVEQCEYVRGPFSKYVGSQTSSRMQTFKLLNLSGGDFATAVNTLLALGTWFSLNGACPNLLGFIKQELESRASGLKDILEHVMKSSRGGCMEHRYSSPGDVIGSYSSSQSLMSTHYRLCTDTATLFGRSSEDFELFFQPIMQCAYGLLRFQKVTRVRLKAKIEMDHCTRLITNSLYSLPHPMTGIASPLPIGELIEPTIRLAMIRLIKVEYLSPSPDRLKIPSREIGLIATLSAASVSYIRNYQCYKAFPDNSFSKQTRPESVLNLSLVRDVPLESLLYSVVVSLDYHGVFGKCSGRYAIASKLRNWARAVSGIVDVKMFKFLTDAIVQTGQLAQLCKIARSVPRYAALNRGHVLSPVIMIAMANLITERKWRHIKWAILVMDDSGKGSTYRLKRVLVHWVAAYWKKSKGDGYIDPFDYLASRKYATIEGWFLTSNLLGQVEELSRSMDSSVGPSLRQDSASIQLVRKIRLPKFPNFKTQARCKIAEVGFGDCVQSSGGGDPGNSLRRFPHLGRMYQMARFNGTVSGAWVKFAPIISEFQNCIGQCTVGLFLAEGGASAMRYIMHAFPDMTGVFNTLYVADQTDGLDDGGFVPPGLLCPCGLLNRVANVPYLDAAMGDLSNKSTLRNLDRVLSTIIGGPLLMTMDMQDWGAARLTTVIQAIDHFMARDFGVAIIKLFSRDLMKGELQSAVAGWTEKYDMVLRKPVTSNPINDEVYLVMLKHIGKSLKINPIPAMVSCNLFLTSLKEISPFTYIQDLIAFCRIDQGLPACMQSSAISLGYKAEPCKFTTPALYEAFMTIHTIRRDLTSETDLLSREFGVLFDSNSHGSTAVLENYQSLLLATLAMYLLSNVTFSPLTQGPSKMSNTDFMASFIPIISTQLRKFSLLSSIDNTWRRLGEMYGSDRQVNTIADLHFLTSIHHYQTKMPAGLLHKFAIPSHLAVLASLNQHRLQNLGSNNAPILLFSKGLNFLSSIFAAAGSLYRGPCRIVSVEPAWMEDILTSKEWAIKFSSSGTWGLVITMGDISRIKKPPHLKALYVIFHPQKVYESEIEVDEASLEYSLKVEGEKFRWMYIRL